MLAIALLLVGALIYILFRSQNHLVFVVADMLGLGGVIDSMRAGVADVDAPEFVRFNLPDGLWSMAYILITDYIFRNDPLWSRMLWVSIIPIVGTCSELLQLIGWLPGVYDPLDLVAYLLPLGIYFIMTILNKDK